MWGNVWGQFVWNQVASVPALGWWGALLLGALLGIVAARSLRGTRPRAVAPFIVLFVIIVPMAALALPFTFTNGTVADANQVNANFAAVTTTTYRLSQVGSHPILSLVDWTMVGQPVTITTNAQERITGALTATVTVASGTNLTIQETLCYRTSPQTGILSFAGTEAGQQAPVGIVALPSSTSTAMTTAADTVVPGAGTWQVGLCARNPSIANADINRVIGWFQVTAN